MSIDVIGMIGGAWHVVATAPIVDPECQIPVCTQLNIGSSQLNSAYFNGHISRVLYFPSALTAVQIQELTK